MRPLRLLSHKTVSFSSFPSRNLPSLILRNYSAYEAEGKTYGKILNKQGLDNSGPLLLDSVTSRGFRLVNRIHVLGPIIIFPHMVLSWNVESAADVNEDSLSLFSVLEPKIDMLIIGYGNRNEYTRDVQINIFKACKALNVNFEAMSTDNALATFNFLSSDRRFVAAALIPPVKLSFYGMEDEVNRMDAVQERMLEADDWGQTRVPVASEEQRKLRDHLLGKDSKASEDGKDGKDGKDGEK